MTSGKKHLRWSSEELCLIVLSSLSNRGCAEETISFGCWFFVYSTVRRFSQVSILCIDALHFFNFLFNIGMLACNCFFVDGCFFVDEYPSLSPTLSWITALACTVSTTQAEQLADQTVRQPFCLSFSFSTRAATVQQHALQVRTYLTVAYTVHCCVLKVILLGI